jgi:type IV pilus assembly protein PilY1
LLDGSARVNYYTLDNAPADELTGEDRQVADLPIGGLPPKPQRMRIDDKNIICVGTFCTDFEAPVGVVETYWYEE